MASLAHGHFPVDGSQGWEVRDLPADRLLPGHVWMDRHGDSIRGVIESVERVEAQFAYRVYLHGGFSFLMTPYSTERVLVDVARSESKHERR